MPFQIVRNDITRMKVDAIVNSSNEELIGAGGADLAIHDCAGPQMDRDCLALGGCKPGEVKPTPGYRLPCKYVFHTVAPVWKDGHHQEKQQLASCYKNALRLAGEKGCESIAFPLMASGVNGFPRGEALRIATDTIREWLKKHYMDVYLVVYDKKSFVLCEAFYQDIPQYINDHYIPPRFGGSRLDRVRRCSEQEMALPLDPQELNGKQWNLEESFSHMLLRKIDEKGMTDADCYNRANLDRRLFSKIRCDASYHPSKITVLALAIALELPLDEVELLLQKAGYALSDSYLWDVIIKYFISHHFYDVYTINEYLYEQGQPQLLGKVEA